MMVGFLYYKSKSAAFLSVSFLILAIGLMWATG
jgi:hypothetical protein